MSSAVSCEVSLFLFGQEQTIRTSNKHHLQQVWLVCWAQTLVSMSMVVVYVAARTWCVMWSVEQLGRGVECGGVMWSVVSGSDRRPVRNDTRNKE